MLKTRIAARCTFYLITSGIQQLDKQEFMAGQPAFNLIRNIYLTPLKSPRLPVHG